MKYTKGSFITVPNKEVLKGQSPNVQVLFMWLCHYANTTGECFPSQKALANDCGLSPRAIGYAMNQLVSVGIVEKSPQFQDNRQTTNLYTINVGVHHVQGGGCTTDTPRVAPRANRTQSKELNPYEHKRILISRKEIPRFNADLRASIRSVSAGARV